MQSPHETSHSLWSGGHFATHNPSEEHFDLPETEA